MIIQVQIKTIYGKNVVYPICDKAKRMAVMLNQKTFTTADIENIKALGFTLEVVNPTVTL